MAREIKFESGLPDEIFSNPQEIRTKEFLKKFMELRNCGKGFSETINL